MALMENFTIIFGPSCFFSSQISAIGKTRLNRQYILGFSSFTFVYGLCLWCRATGTGEGGQTLATVYHHECDTAGPGRTEISSKMCQRDQK